jgi:hypothetical protein
MDTLLSLRDWAKDILEDDSIDGVIDSWINSAIVQASKMFSWDALRREWRGEIASGEFIQPPLAYNLNLLCPITDASGVIPDEKFVRRHDRPVARDSMQSRHWYISSGMVTDAMEEYEGVIVQGASTITPESPAVMGSGWPEEADVGKLLTIAGDQTKYEITAMTDEAITVFPDIAAESAATAAIFVGNRGQKKYLLHTQYNELYSGSAVCSYQMEHPRLALDDQRLLIPCEQTVRLLVLQQAMRQNKYDVDAERLRYDLQSAFRLEMGPEGEENEITPPRGLNGGPPLFSGTSSRTRPRGLFGRA